MMPEGDFKSRITGPVNALFIYRTTGSQFEATIAGLVVHFSFTEVTVTGHLILLASQLSDRHGSADSTRKAYLR
jgi:hypothetical protein